MKILISVVGNRFDFFVLYFDIKKINIYYFILKKNP